MSDVETRQGQLKMELLLDGFLVAFAEHGLLLALPTRLCPVLGEGFSTSDGEDPPLPAPSQPPGL